MDKLEMQAHGLALEYIRVMNEKGLLTLLPEAFANVYKEAYARILANLRGNS